MNEFNENRVGSLGFIKIINVFYALIPLFFAFTLTLPILEDNGVAILLTYAYPGWYFYLVMLPASCFYFLGSRLKYARIALIMGVVLCIAFPLLDVTLDLGFLKGGMESFNTYLHDMSQNGYRYFQSRNPFSYLGSIWLVVPALVLVIISLVGIKYQPRVTKLISLNDLKEMGFSEGLNRLKHEAMELKRQALILANTENGFSTRGLSLNAIIKLSSRKLRLIGFATISLVIAAAFVFSGSSGPSESDVVDIVSSEMEQVGFSLNVHEYSIEDCEQGHDNSSFRCRVTSSATLTHDKDRSVKIKSRINNEWKIFTYDNGFLSADLDYVLSGEAQQKVAMLALGDVFKELSSSRNKRW